MKINTAKFLSSFLVFCGKLIILAHLDNQEMSG